MRKAFYILIMGLSLTLFGTGAVHAQGKQIPSGAISENKVAAKLGTFLLIRTGKVEEAINTDILYLIEEHRKDHEEIYFVLSQNLLVKILPKDEISKPDFVPFQHLYMDEEKGKGATK